MFLLTFSGVGAVGPTIDLGYATYRGTELGNGVNQWLGVRYAAAPLGDLRFRDPQGPVSVDDVQAANVVRALQSLLRQSA